MSILSSFLEDVPLPVLYRVRRNQPQERVTDVADTIQRAFACSGILHRLSPHAEVAIGVGSRGIHGLPDIVRAVVACFVAHGARPFIVPCMGSHGGGTAEGQTQVLADIGVSEHTVGCPIRSCMDVVRMTELDNGLPVYMDSLAAGADAVFVINRIKAHTAFTGPHESGLLKMLTIGLGKHTGATACHRLGFGIFAELMPRMATSLLNAAPNILGGLAVVENARDETCLLEVVPRETLAERDAALLCIAKQRMGKLPFQKLDVLLIHRMGKDISGAGMDPNVTGRAPSPYVQSTLQVTRMGVLNLTEQTKGNATGLGNADVIPQSLLDNVNFAYTYANAMTSTMLRAAFTPIVMPTDLDVIRCLIKTCNTVHNPPRLVYIRDTLTVNDFWISESLLDEVRCLPDTEILPGNAVFHFDATGILTEPSMDNISKTFI